MVVVAATSLDSEQWNFLKMDSVSTSFVYQQPHRTYSIGCFQCLNVSCYSQTKLVQEKEAEFAERMNDMTSQVSLI